MLPPLGLPLGSVRPPVRASVYLRHAMKPMQARSFLFMFHRTSPIERTPTLLWAPHFHSGPTSPCLLHWPLSNAPPVLFYRPIAPRVSMEFPFASLFTPLLGPCSGNCTRFGCSKVRCVLGQAPRLISSFQHRGHFLAPDLIYSKIICIRQLLIAAMTPVGPSIYLMAFFSALSTTSFATVVLS